MAGKRRTLKKPLEKPPHADERRDRLVAMVDSLTGVEVSVAGVQHLTFKVNKKAFGYYVYDHHGDGRIALWCKAPPGEQGRLVEESPGRYFAPPYVGPQGWVALRLCGRSVNWDEVKNLLLAAYWMTAPRPRPGGQRRKGQ